jgi:hypothetical protein
MQNLNVLATRTRRKATTPTRANDIVRIGIKSCVTCWKVRLQLLGDSSPFALIQGFHVHAPDERLNRRSTDRTLPALRLDTHNIEAKLIFVDDPVDAAIV